MSYTAWSVVFGEQPTAAKWNQLGTNDAGFKDGTNIDDDAIIARHISGFDKSNLTTDSNPYKFKAYRNAALTTVNGYQKISLDTELYDTNNNFSGGTYTVPVNGFYHFDWMFTIVITATSNDTVGVLYKNGVVETWGMEIESQGGSGGSDTIQLAAGDTIELWAYTQAASTVIATKMTTRLTGYLVSRT